MAPLVIDFYNKKLLYSGYPLEHRIRIIEGGISSYQAKLNVSNIEAFYKTAENTMVARNKSKLLLKNNWYN